MSKHRHHVMKKKEGGSVIPNKGEMDKDDKPLNAGGDPDVEDDAEDKAEAKQKRKHGGAVGGHAAKHRMDRPARKAGGRVGSDKSPLSESSSVKPLTSAGKC